jgi:hypothetical protein
MQISLQKLNEEKQKDQKKIIILTGMNLSPEITATTMLVDVVATGVHVANTIHAIKIVKQLIKEGTQKTLIKASGKTIPILGSIFSTVIGLGSGSYRIYHGELLQGALEITSGLITWIPVAGPAISIGIDIGVMGIDLYKYIDSYNEHLTDTKALEILDLKIPNPTQAQVHNAYLTQVRFTHPDTMGAAPKEIKYQNDCATKILGAAKDFLYKKNNWS